MRNCTHTAPFSVLWTTGQHLHLHLPPTPTPTRHCPLRTASFLSVTNSFSLPSSVVAQFVYKTQAPIRQEARVPHTHTTPHTPTPPPVPGAKPQAPSAAGRWALGDGGRVGESTSIRGVHVAPRAAQSPLGRLPARVREGRIGCCSRCVVFGPLVDQPMGLVVNDLSPLVDTSTTKKKVRKRCCLLRPICRNHTD